LVCGALRLKTKSWSADFILPSKLKITYTGIWYGCADTLKIRVNGTAKDVCFLHGSLWLIIMMLPVHFSDIFVMDLVSQGRCLLWFSFILYETITAMSRYGTGTKKSKINLN
jgi:hypothetical protein